MIMLQLKKNSVSFQDIERLLKITQLMKKMLYFGVIPNEFIRSNPNIFSRKCGCLIFNNFVRGKIEF